MKDKKSTQKVIIKIFSVFAAIILWLFVSYNEGGLIDANIKSVEIQYVGEQALASKGLMVVDKKTSPKASVKIRGKRSDLISVMSGVTAKVDLSKIERAGTHKVSPSFDIPSNAVYISKINTQSIEINIAQMVEKTIDVVVMQENADKNKMFLVESVAEIQKMKIVGEKNDIENIKYAYLYIDVSATSNPEEVTAKPVFVSENEKEAVLKNEIFTEISEIKVKNDVYFRKTADINIEISSIRNNRYMVSLISQSVDKIEVGVVDANTQPDSITANFDDITILEPGRQKFSLSLEVPEGVYLPENNKIIEVEIDVMEYSEHIEQ